ncbi:acyl-ACP--UDP-N-acetylglucosamine O-acyltransferase [Candidatus Parabeggiatoa sp. HSG14]|uniref:acyl-ACP--UDP-N-acetylglucosamine O-acyltransferase n=1 Tax=Candidatus Parabeggiatoa sp. HSG14 TaxID=3055593 RepID=UPI0025A7F57A|nr:acyl-ACP--UDP-N-acetylglucosamine O-acyltransferase [Thiotrichales bacterium HSG14]
MIDAHALVDPKAELDSDVQVGPYSIIGAHVKIASGTWIGPHVVIKGPTQIGHDNKIYQFASLGEVPQDKKYKGELDTHLKIGDRNEIREYCTMNRGTIQGGGVTCIGDDNWIMAYCHIAHDCQVGNQTIFSNGASLAGHVRIEDYVILGGFTGVHQFCVMGMHSFAGASSLIFKDVPPFVTVWGNRAEAYGINKEGLKRRGFSSDTIMALHKAYKIIYKKKLTIEQAIEELNKMTEQYSEVRQLVTFLKESTRGIVR